jgi:WD40 repeat protein
LWNTTPLTEDPPGRSRRLQGHHQGALGVVFSPDQRHLLTASIDGKAKLWNAD